MQEKEEGGRDEEKREGRKEGRKEERDGEDKRKLVALKVQGLKIFTKGLLSSPRHSQGSRFLFPKYMRGG